MGSDDDIDFNDEADSCDHTDNEEADKSQPPFQFYPAGFGQNVVRQLTPQTVAPPSSRKKQPPLKKQTTKKATAATRKGKAVPSIAAAPTASLNAAALTELWFAHPDIITDVLNANGMEAIAIRYHRCRLMMFKKRNISGEDRARVVDLIEVNARGVLSSETMSKLRQALKNCVSHSMDAIRKQFDAATRQFFEDESTSEWRSWFSSWTRMGDGFAGLKEPFIDPAKLNKYFVQDNIGLVGDIWAPILGITMPNFLQQPDSGAYQRLFLDVTLKILCDFITIKYKSSGDNILDTQSKTAAIRNADVDLGPMARVWPPLAKPEVWKKNREKVAWNGELRYSEYHAGMSKDDIQDIIEDRISATQDVATGIPAPQAVPAEHVGRLSGQLIDYCKSLAMRDIDTLEQMISDARNRQQGIIQHINDLEGWIIEKERLSGTYIDLVENGPSAYDQTVSQAMVMMKEAKQKERAARIENTQLQKDHIPVGELCRSFRAFTLFLRDVNKQISDNGPSQQQTAPTLVRRTPSPVPGGTTTMALNTRAPNSPPIEMVEQTPPPRSPEPDQGRAQETGGEGIKVQGITPPSASERRLQPPPFSRDTHLVSPSPANWPPSALAPPNRTTSQLSFRSIME
ncbi:hypothetical protein EDC01DRAFT_633334 [Geopyxis carbonaria]|nr:hypothetical protein EDC01DRAFT_633334 [Geopyxis carbonaria]